MLRLGLVEGMSDHVGYESRSLLTNIRMRCVMQVTEWIEDQAKHGLGLFGSYSVHEVSLSTNRYRAPVCAAAARFQGRTVSDDMCPQVKARLRTTETGDDCG